MKTTYTGPESGVMTFPAPSKSFTMEAYDHNGEGWTLEIRITGNHYQVYNDDRLLRGSSLGAVMRGQVQKEVLRRGINATEKY